MTASTVTVAAVKETWMHKHKPAIWNLVSSFLLNHPRTLDIPFTRLVFGIIWYYLTCRSVYADMLLIIQDPSVSNPAVMARLFDNTAMRRDQKSSEFPRPSYSNEKSITHLCACRLFTLSAANPELCFSLCVWHKAQRTLPRLCYIIKLGDRFQHSLSDPSVSSCWDPKPELSTTGGQYVNAASATHWGRLITPTWTILKELMATDLVQRV